MKIIDCGYYYKLPYKNYRQHYIDYSQSGGCWHVLMPFKDINV